ncbi:hypothetical protein [Pseudosulfitobacter pseudonitzschiae]|uniref:hypothetical protein n=1 Tax=Pseudosulfitobacter pseudonitzschiae TaxID=1402135 RepID=UPI003B7CC6A4
MTIDISPHIQAQGAFVRWQDDGRAVVNVDDDNLIGKLVGDTGNEMATEVPCP